MPLLVNPFKRSPREVEPEPPEETQPVEDEIGGSSLRTNRLVVLRLSAGGLAYRLHAFPDFESAAEYAQANLLPHTQPGGVITFWALHRPPKVADSKEPAEAVVIVRDPQREDVIQIYSFVDMDAAQEFVRQEFTNGIDFNLVFVFWAGHVDLSDAAGQPPEQAEPERAYFSVPALQRRTSERPKEMAQPSASKIAKQPTKKKKAPEPETDQPDQTEPTVIDQLKQHAAVIMERIQTWPGWNGLAPRVFKAATMDEVVYEEAFRDPHAMGRARLIIGVGIVAAALGASRGGVDAIALHLVAAATGWAAYAGVIYGFSNLAFAGRTGPKPWRQLLQTLGLASVPMSLLFFAIIPTYGPIPVLAAFFWMFVTTVHAISPPLNIDRQSAVVSAAIGCLTFFAIALVAPVLLA